jgi:TRAP-type C4-dicarboxylate transport system permease small subunit
MRRLLGIFENILTTLSLGSIFFIMILTTADAVGRYVFRFPIKGAYEIIQDYLMIIAVFFGISYAFRGGGFISVDFLVDRMSPKIKIALNTFSQLFSIFLSVIFVWAAVKRCLRAIDLVENTPQLWNLPLWPSYAVIPVGLFFATLVMILHLWGTKKKSTSLSKEVLQADGDR